MVLILAGLVTSRYQAANGYATFGRYLVTITPPLRGSALGSAPRPALLHPLSPSFPEESSAWQFAFQ